MSRKLGAKAMVTCVTIILVLVLILVQTPDAPYDPGVREYTIQRGMALQERFVVEQVNFDRENKGIIVYVRNVGVREVSIVAIYINGTGYTGNALNPQSPCVVSTQYAVVVTTGVGSLCQFNLTWPTAWNSGSVFNIVVASARGNQASFTSRAP